MNTCTYTFHVSEFGTSPRTGTTEKREPYVTKQIGEIRRCLKFTEDPLPIMKETFHT